MGLLDDYDKLLRGKPKTLPFGANLDPTANMAITAGDEFDPTMKGRNIEALQLKAEQGALPSAPTPGGTLAGPNQQRAFAFGDQPGAGFGPTPPQGRNLATAVADAAPPKINLAEMDFGIGDKSFPAPKNQSRLAEGLPMTAPEPLPSAFGQPKVAGGIAPTPSSSMPTPGSGLLSNAPLPPPRPGGIGGMPPTRSAAAMPLPPPRPAGLGGASSVASTTAPPMPPVRPPGIGGETTGGLLASNPITPTASIVPPAPPIAPIIPPTPPIAAPIGGAMAGGAGSLGGAAGAAGGAMGGLGGALGAIGSIASAFMGGGKKGPPPPQAKAPELPPPRAGAEQAQQEQASRSQAPQILQGILASSAQNSLDPRKRRQLA